MKRQTLPIFAGLIALSTIAAGVLAAATPNPIHPSTLGTGGPILVAIVGDHYLATEEREFNYDVDNFIKRGLLLDSFYKEHENDWRFVSYFQPTDPGKESRYGFKIGLGDGNCAVIDNEELDPLKNTVKLLAADVGTDTPRFTIVLGNHPYNFGCSKNNWIYVAVDAVGTDVLQHEFGHKIGFLYDEWFAPTPENMAMSMSAATSTPSWPPPGWSPNDTRNCWPKGTGAPPTHWSQHVPSSDFYQPFDDVLGCENHAVGVIHPYKMCRMGGTAHPPKFCDVCRLEMKNSFTDLVNEAIAAAGYINNSDASHPDTLSLRASHAPTSNGFGIINAAFVTQQPSAPMIAKPIPAMPILKMVVRYNTTTKTATIIEMLDGNGQYVPNYRRAGQHMYAIRDGANLVDVGVIPDQAFQAHGSRGGAPHQTATSDVVELVLMVPGRTVDSLRTRPLQMQFYKIPANITERSITKVNFPKLNDGDKVFEKMGNPVPVLLPSTGK